MAASVGWPHCIVGEQHDTITLGPVCQSNKKESPLFPFLPFPPPLLPVELLFGPSDKGHVTSWENFLSHFALLPLRREAVSSEYGTKTNKIYPISKKIELLTFSESVTGILMFSVAC